MDDVLHRWCLSHLGSRPSSEIFRTGHLSEVIGVRLADGRQVVIKIRPGSKRLESTTEIQQLLNLGGFPCPGVIAGPVPFGDLVATAETYVPARGAQPESPPPAATAQLLAALVQAAPPAEDFPALNPAPPWVGWDHAGRDLWPWPDDLDVDMNQHPGPVWVDDLARRIRTRLAAVADPPVIGHIDWEANNLDWDGGTPVLVHDWDSLAIRAEAGIAGAAATVYPSNGATAVAATLDETAAFLDAYARACPGAWSSHSEQVAWCAGLWVITYNAKKESLGGGTGYLEHLERERCTQRPLRHLTPATHRSSRGDTARDLAISALDRSIGVRSSLPRRRFVAIVQIALAIWLRCAPRHAVGSRRARAAARSPARSRRASRKEPWSVLSALQSVPPLP